MPPSTEHPLERQLAAAWPPDRWRDVTVLAAVSGGADSVALLLGLCRLQARPGALVAAHFNHKLRGDESEADEAFVREVCGRLSVPFRVGHATPEQREAVGGSGLEATARRARYDFLLQTAEQAGARYVAVAHTADDQAETILHRILRGTGLAGLAGMARTRPLSPATTLVRPLLAVRRGEVLEYLSSMGQPYREDATNRDPRFTRNRIRHQLLPALAAEYNPTVTDALLRLGLLAGEAQGVIDRLVEPLAERCVQRQPGGAVVIEVAPLAGQPAYLVRELLMSLWRQQHWPEQQMSFQQWDALAGLIQGGWGGEGWRATSRTFPGRVQAERGPDRLTLWRGEG